MKAQMKVADRAHAAYAVIVGRAELEHATVAVKDMQSGEQLEVHREQIAGWLRERCEARES